MNTNFDNTESPVREMESKLDSAYDKAHHLMERGAEAFEQVERKVSDAYDKTAHAVGDTYVKAKDFSHENPGKTALIALGIGVGVGIVLGANVHRSRSRRIAEPVVNALSDVALAFFR